MINYINTISYYIYTYFCISFFVIIVHCPINMYFLSQLPLIHHISFYLPFLFCVLSHPPLPYSQLQWESELAIQSFSVYSFTFCTYHWKKPIFCQCSDSTSTDPLCKLAWLYPQWVTEIHFAMSSGYICTNHLLACILLSLVTCGVRWSSFGPNLCPIIETYILLYIPSPGSDRPGGSHSNQWNIKEVISIPPDLWPVVWIDKLALTFLT